jgi:cell division protein ZapA
MSEEQNSAKAISISILGKEYLISCGENERADLISAADYLDDKMREIRDSGKVVGTDRIAVMAALNIAHDLLSQSSSSSKSAPDVENRIKSIQSKIEDALFRSRQLELEA